MTSGFLVVDKPHGATSNFVVGQVKKATGIKKIGHAGTLDPMATGALVMAIGGVTRLVKFVQGQEKEYVAKAQFGVATDTLDADGSVLTREPMDFDRDELEAVVPRFVGEIMQTPPMVSALKMDGRRLYELAREGEVVERDARPVVIDELEILDVGAPPYPEVEFRVVCGKGTYVRSLADDMARALGGTAHLTALRRTRIGSLKASLGLTVDDLSNWEQYLMSPADAVGLPVVKVDADDEKGVRNGVRFVGGPLVEVDVDGPFLVVNAEGETLAVYKHSDGKAIPDVVMPN